MLEVGDPTNTVLGYIQTDYGRAVAYLDGHVKWENKG
jgi:prepilin-type processing-associated H-X9-DG protein